MAIRNGLTEEEVRCGYGRGGNHEDHSEEKPRPSDMSHTLPDLSAARKYAVDLHL